MNTLATVPQPNPCVAHGLPAVAETGPFTEAEIDWQDRLREESAAGRGGLWPGAAGLALGLDARALRDHGPHLLADDADLFWVTMVALPTGPATGLERGVLWASAHRTADRYGMPGVGGDWPLQTCDFRRRPLGAAGVGRREVNPGGALPGVRAAFTCVLDGGRCPRLFRILSGLWEGLLGYGFTRRRDFRQGVSRYRRLRGLPAGFAGPFHFHGPRSARPRPFAPRAADCLPRPLLAFPAADAGRLFDRVLAAGADPAGLYLPAAGRDRFAADVLRGLPVESQWAGRYAGVVGGDAGGDGTGGLLDTHRVVDADDGVHDLRLPRSARVCLEAGSPVQIGGVIAHAGPAAVPARPGCRLDPCGRWDLAVASLGRSAPEAFRSWFDRQSLYLPDRPGIVYFPADLAAAAARDWSMPGGLVWDLGPCESLFDEESESFRFPPVPQRSADDWSIALPNEVVLDLRPRLPRRRPPGAIPITGDQASRSPADEVFNSFTPNGRVTRSQRRRSQRRRAWSLAAEAG